MYRNGWQIKENQIIKLFIKKTFRTIIDSSSHSPKEGMYSSPKVIWHFDNGEHMLLQSLHTQLGWDLWTVKVIAYDLFDHSSDVTAQGDLGFRILIHFSDTTIFKDTARTQQH